MSFGEIEFLTAGDIAAQPSDDERAVDEDLAGDAERSNDGHRSTERSKIKTPKPPREPSAASNRRWFIAGAVVGTIGLVCSIVLAVGALTVALGVSTDNSAVSQLSSLCDFLVGPVRDLFTFDGPSGDKKGALVAWGIGSIGYLLVGRFLQSVLHNRVKN